MGKCDTVKGLLAQKKLYSNYYFTVLKIETLFFEEESLFITNQN